MKVKDRNIDKRVKQQQVNECKSYLPPSCISAALCLLCTCLAVFAAEYIQLRKSGSPKVSDNETIRKIACSYRNNRLSEIRVKLC